MANINEKFGLRPARQLNGSPFINAQNRYRVLSTNTTTIYQGDLVVPLSDGTIARAPYNVSTAIVGVFNGCFYTDPTTQKPTWKNYLPGSTVATDIVAFVIDGPETVFEINADEPFATTCLFSNYFVSDTTGNTKTGISYVQLDVSTSTTAVTGNVKAIDISQDPDNSDTSTSGANIMVYINNHFYRSGTPGL